MIFEKISAAVSHTSHKLKVFCKIFSKTFVQSILYHVIIYTYKSITESGSEATSLIFVGRDCVKWVHVLLCFGAVFLRYLVVQKMNCLWNLPGFSDGWLRSDLRACNQLFT